MIAGRTRAFVSLRLVAILALSLVASAPARAGDSITPPHPISKLDAAYPERASGEHDVLLSLLVAADGSVEEARVVEGQTPFTDAALTAAKGSAVGLELHVERKLTERLGGFVSYTLSRSTRYTTIESFAARPDRTHVLQGALSWAIGRGFRVGARATLLSGRPLQSFVAELVGSTREPPFFRLDVRAEKRWTIGKRGYVSLVLEMLNATLSGEPYENGLQCESSTDCSVGRGTPVSLPSLGVEGGM